MMKRTTGMLSQDAIHAASRLFEGSVMKRVRTFFPWFNRTEGRDHFTVIAADHGRCSLLPFVSDPSVYGNMFFLQVNRHCAVKHSYSSTALQRTALFVMSNTVLYSIVSAVLNCSVRLCAAD